MAPELSIKLQYLDSRTKPAELFEAMALYIKAYEDLGRLLTRSVGLETDFEFQLNAVEKSSILSKLSAVKDTIDKKFQEIFYSAGNTLLEQLIDLSETKTEEDVESLAQSVECYLSEELPEGVSEPYVERKALAFVLAEFSKANERVQPDETVTIATNGQSSNGRVLNTAWRFTGNPKEMFLGRSEHVDSTDYLYVIVSVNAGNSVWTFYSVKMHRKFTAKIIDKDWLERYQNGLTRAVGPKDVIEAEVSYDVYTPPEGRSQQQIRNAKIVKIIDIARDNGHQYEIGMQ